MYKVVVFDFFGVFCAPIATNWLKKTFPGDESKLVDFQALCTRSDYGKLSRADFNRKISKLTGVAVDEIVAGIEAETVINTRLVAYTQNLLNRGYRIACLSNGTHEWTLHVITEYGLGSLFEEIILSADLGIVKPSLEIYTHALQKLKIPANQTIFVDDRKPNVDAAEVCGMRGLIFSNTPTFIKDLEVLLSTNL